jgi:DNA-binding MarR family transcriptional regulator
MGAHITFITFMNNNNLKKNKSCSREITIILDGVRKIVRAIHESSRETEKVYGLSAAQLFVLQTLVESPDPLSVGELARRTYTHQSSVSVVVARLVEKKLIIPSTSTEDSRIKELTLSKKGRELLSQPVPTVQENLADAIRQMSETERNQLADGLLLLAQLAGLDDEEPSLFFEEEKIST